MTSGCDEIHTHYNDKQACYSDIYQQLGLPILSQLIAMKISLTAASTLCLSQTEQEIQDLTYYSQFELSRYDENLSRYSEYSQRQRLTNPSLLVTVIITLAATNASYLK